MNDPGKSRAWFDQGYEAFSRTFPRLAIEHPGEKFYVCPICVRPITEFGLEAGFLSREDVPPKSLGGRPMVLTCHECNSQGGHGADVHAHREEKHFNLLSGGVVRGKARLVTESGSIPIDLSAGGGGLLMFGVSGAAPPSARGLIDQDFGSMKRGEAAVKFTIQLDDYSKPRSAASWLRSAYLTLFAAFGYKFILRPELNLIRERILKPESDAPETFRVIRPQIGAPSILRVDSPDIFRAYVVAFGRNIIYLPRYGDMMLYERLAAHPNTNVVLKGLEYPWPSGPVFMHDQGAA